MFNTDGRMNTKSNPESKLARFNEEDDFIAVVERNTGVVSLQVVSTVARGVVPAQRHYS